MRIAISGSTGFIGTHLTKYLQERNHSVYAIPREHFDTPKMIEETLTKYPPDHIIHLSAYGNHSTQTDEVKILNTNVVKTFNLLQATRNINYISFINIGSSSEYGTKKKPMKETDLPETDTFYGASKVASTYMCRAFAKKYRKNVITVRPFSVYGPGEADFRFIPTVCKSIIEGKTMTLVEEPHHDWIYVDDFCKGVDVVMQNADKLRGQVVNIGTGKQYSNRQVVDALEKIAGKELKRDVFGSYTRDYDSEYWVASNKKLKTLGWKPNYTLSNGLKRVYLHEVQKSKAQST